jgi:acyl-CoA thioester hydrolase
MLSNKDQTLNFKLNCRKFVHMKEYITQVQIRWSDLDSNVHLRHSVYYDWGALSRINFLTSHGLTTELMQQLQFGPILFREECVFKREIRLGDAVTISLELIRAKRNYSKWSIRHTIIKSGDTVAAILIVDGAWIDTAKRKLAIPPAEVSNAFLEMPVAEDMEWVE